MRKLGLAGQQTAGSVGRRSNASSVADGSAALNASSNQINQASMPPDDSSPLAPNSASNSVLEVTGVRTHSKKQTRAQKEFEHYSKNAGTQP